MTKKELIVVSVSRRTDIPAYYPDWFRKRLEIGYAVYPNPYSNKPVFLDLSPEQVKAFVFWTRNPRPLFKHLDYIDDVYEKRHYMHFTINGLPKSIESRNPKIESAVECAKFLAERYGIHYVQWRFDPIIISSPLTSTHFVIDKFGEIAEKLRGVTQRCYFSFVDLYKKTEKNFKIVEQREGISFDRRYTTNQMEENFEEQKQLIMKINQIANDNQITLYACAEDSIQQALPGIEKAHCVDADLVERVSQASSASQKFTPMPSRIGCGCIESRDVGYYDSCPHGCIYCYANMDPDEALKKAKEYAAHGFPLDNEIRPAIGNTKPIIKIHTPGNLF